MKDIVKNIFLWILSNFLNSKLGIWWHVSNDYSRFMCCLFSNYGIYQTINHCSCVFLSPFGELFGFDKELLFFKAKVVSEEGFEPSPPIGDQNTPVTRKDSHLESGALDHSAILTIKSL